MKKKIKLWWPYQAHAEEEIEVEIPEGTDPDEWLKDNEDRLVEEVSHEEIHPNAYDLGYAGAKFVE